jgi:nitroreductase
MSTPFDLKVTDALLSTTRAVRKRLDLAKPVPREVILDCIRLSQQAPTGSNAQTWRWLVITDPDLRKQLGRIYKEGGGQYIEMARKQAEGGDAQTRRTSTTRLSGCSTTWPRCRCT